MTHYMPPRVEYNSQQEGRHTNRKQGHGMAEQAANDLPEAVGDWNVRGLDADQKFATPGLRADCIDAANRAQRANPRFPGWQLYSRIIRGDTCFDRQLAAYSIQLARAFTRAKKINGRSVVSARYRNNAWISQCAVDALEFAIVGRYSASADARGAELEINDETYTYIRDTVAAFLGLGIEDFTHELHYQLRRVELYNRWTMFIPAESRAA